MLCLKFYWPKSKRLPVLLKIKEKEIVSSFQRLLKPFSNQHKVLVLVFAVLLVLVLVLVFVFCSTEAHKLDYLTWAMHEPKATFVPALISSSWEANPPSREIES